MTDGMINDTARLARHANVTAHLPSLLVLFRSYRGASERVSSYNVSVVMAHFTAARTAAVVVVNERTQSNARIVAVKGDFTNSLPPPPPLTDELLLEECPLVSVAQLRMLPSRVYAPMALGTLPLEGGRTLRLDALLRHPSFDVVTHLSEAEFEDIARAYLARGDLPTWRARLNQWLVQVNNDATETITQQEQESTGLHALIRRLGTTESAQERQAVSSQIQSAVREGALRTQEAEQQAREAARRPRAIINAALAAVTALESAGMNATSLGHLSNRASRARTISRNNIATLADLNTEGAPEEEDLILYEVGHNALALRAMTDVDHNTSDEALNEPLRIGQYRENAIFEPTIVSLEMADQIEQMDASPLTRQRLSVCLPIVSLRDANNREAVFQRLCLVFMSERSMSHVWLIALSSILRTLEMESWADPESTPTGRLLQWFAMEIMQYVELPVGSRLSPTTRQPINTALVALLQDEILTVHSSVMEASVILRLLQRFGGPAAFSNDDLRRSMLARIATAVPQSHRDWLQANAASPWLDQGPGSLGALLSSLYRTRVDADGAHVPISGTEHLVESLDSSLTPSALRAISTFARAIGLGLDDMVTPGLTVVVLSTVESVTSPHVSSTAAVRLVQNASGLVASEMTAATAGTVVSAEEAMDAVRRRLAWARTPLHPLSPFTTPFGPSVLWFYAPDGTVSNMAEGYQILEDEVAENPESQLLHLTEHLRENRGRLMARFYGTQTTGAFSSETITLPLYREMADEYRETPPTVDLTSPEEASAFVHRVSQRLVGRSGTSAGNRHLEDIEREIAMLLPSLLESARSFGDIALTEPRPLSLIRRVQLELGDRSPAALGQAPDPVWVPRDDPELLETLIRVQQAQSRARVNALRQRRNASAPVPAAVPRGLARGNMGNFQRAVTWYLRHGANEGTRPDGYVPISTVLEALSENFGDATVDQIFQVAETDEKGRFSVMEEDGVLYIRANQGHTISSVNPDLLMIPIDRPEDVPVTLHGTYEDAFRNIVRSGGLNRMQREMIQMATGLPGDPEVRSGIRSNVEVVIYIDVERAMRHHGLRFYRSTNNVICCVGPIPVDCFLRVIRLRDGSEIDF